MGVVDNVALKNATVVGSRTYNLVVHVKTMNPEGVVPELIML